MTDSDKKTPIQKALDSILRQAQQGEMPMPKAVLIHPQDLAVSSQEGPLMKAYREMQGQVISSISWDEQHRMDKTELERQLEDSLWARATLHTPIFTLTDLAKHLGPGHLEGDRVIKRVFDKHVLVLCPCMTMLEMNHCEGPVYPRVEAGPRCQNFVVAKRYCAECVQEGLAHRAVEVPQGW